MNQVCARYRGWLLPMVLILFIIEVLLFPVVVSVSYAGRSKSPEHILTYTKGNLNWDADTMIRKDGTGELSLFQDAYQNTRSGDLAKVVAPGTDGFNLVRLKNESSGTVGFKAVLYQIQRNEALPVEVDMTAGELRETSDFPVPDPVDRKNVIRAYEGELQPGTIRDLDIHWNWDFEENELQDIKDTEFGDKAAFKKADDVIVGIYVVIEDDQTHISPNRPKTGDTALTGGYITLLCISGLALLILAVSGRWEKKHEVMEED